jgi:DNA-binding transcriptional regulator YhcF (GntR family)
MAWTFSSDRPVYLQIAERITKSVLSAEFRPGEQLPTVRQLAMHAAVNPNTVQRAYQELENDGIIIVRGTLGRFVTDNSETIERNRKKLAGKLVAELCKGFEELSLPLSQAIEMIKEVQENERA